MTHTVIIGNGVTGITTARHIRKRCADPVTVISDESQHFYSRTALMYIYMGHLKYEHTKPYEDSFWKKSRIDLVKDRVEGIDTKAKRLSLRDGQPLTYDRLVIATGSKSNYFGWPGQDLAGVQGLYGLDDLSKMETNTRGVRRAVIVGGGLIGIEMAEMLRSRHIEVTFLIREDRYWGNILPRAEGLLIGRHIAEHHVDLRLKTNLSEILPDDRGRVRAVRTDQGEEIACEFVGLTAGVSPNIGLAKRSEIPTRRGVLVNEYLETGVADVYAAGDCAEISADGGPGRVEQLWYTGRMQGEALAATLCGKRTKYERGIWFNSAKFFDIEYHTYGFVPAEDQAEWESFYWQDSGSKQCLRLVFRREDRSLVGVNSFGIRYRHRVFEGWLAARRTVEYVVSHLHEANFDPEFFRAFEPQILANFNRAYPEAGLVRDASAKPKKRWGLF